MSKNQLIEPLDFDFNDESLTYHQPSAAKSVEEYSSKLEGKKLYQSTFLESLECNFDFVCKKKLNLLTHFSGLLVKGGVHDKYDANLTYYNLKTARGQRSNMSSLELGRAQGFLYAWNHLKWVYFLFDRKNSQKLL